MKSKVLLLAIFFTITSFGQTTIEFAEPYQFIEGSEELINIKIQVNNIEEYPADEPIIVQLFSDLEDRRALGITTTHGMDKVIFPEQYRDSEEIRIPVNPEVLNNRKSFSLFLRIKEGKENINVSRGRHDVILKPRPATTSYIGIASAATPPRNSLIKNLIYQRIEIPLKIEVRGTYIPTEADKVLVKVRIKDIEASDSLPAFTVAGAETFHKFRVEKRKTPELYEALRQASAAKRPVELEIYGLEHRSKQHIITDPERASVTFYLRKATPGTPKIKKASTGTPLFGKLNNLDAHYSFYAGVNFDFNNNFKFEEAYFEMDVSLLNLFRKVGVKVGIYKSNNSRSLDGNTRYKWIDNELERYDDTDIIYTLKILDIVPNVSTESLGFYFQLPYNFIEAGHFRAFVAPHIELIKRIETYTYESVSEREENTLPAGVNNAILSLNRAPLWKEETKQYWDSYLGLGFPMLYRNSDKGFEVFISPLGGVGYPQRAAENVSFSAKVKAELRPFGAFQFYLAVSTKEKLGFKLGADIRKYFGIAQNPTVSVNLATKFDLSNIMGLAGAK